MVATGLAALLSLVTVLAVQSSSPSASAAAGSSTSATSSSSPLAQLAAEHPGRKVEVIVQLRPGANLATGNEIVSSAGGTVIRELPLINGLATTLPAEDAQRLSLSPAVHAVSLNAAVEHEGLVSNLGTAYNQSIRSPQAWDEGYTGKGVGVAVIDTGIAGSLPDFQVSRKDPSSRVIASAVVNPGATNAGDSLGHGTHVAGLIAGNGLNRPSGDPLAGRYIGVAPEASLISVKAGDENGDASVLDVIDGLQFVVDHKADYNIRVVNLSLKSTVAESYKTDPLDAAVEAAWNSGIVVVVAAGNSGTDADAVSYAPANDPYVITVGGVDDMGTRAVSDDFLASWSSRGTTQDGFAKPDVLAPGARLVSTIPPSASYVEQCPTCVTDGQYFRVGGTSMAAAVVSGAVADLIQSNPALTPDQVKSQLVRRTRPVYKSQSSNTLVDAQGQPVSSSETTSTTIVGGEVALDKAIERDQVKKNLNTGLTSNLLIEPATGLIDYNRTSWSRTSWSQAPPELQATWSRTSWSRTSWSRTSWSATSQSCADFERTSWSRTSWSAEDIASAKAECEALLTSVDPTRTSWSRTSWSRTSWSTSFTK
jgi:serine protease AprX